MFKNFLEFFARQKWGRKNPQMSKNLWANKIWRPVYRLLVKVVT